MLNIFFIILIILFIYYYMSERDMIYIKSKENEYYYVRNDEHKYKVVELLYNIKKNIFILRDHLYDNKNRYNTEHYPYIDQLYNNLQNVSISETPQNTNNSSYTVNKGHEIVFCVRSKKDGNLHDINLMMYVAIHEISHVACPELQHTPLFKKIFTFFCDEAIKLNIYTKIDFDNNPQECCGINITNSIV